MNNLKDTIQKNFDKKKNYNIILSKIERRDNMKVKLSYVLASSLVAIALLVGIVAYNVPKVIMKMLCHQQYKEYWN